MKYLVGYQLPNEDGVSFSEAIEPYFSHIDEVFFPWIDSPSGRSALGNSDGYIDWSAQEHMVKELSDIRKRGVRLDLLLNANCYGAEALSERFCNRILSIIDFLYSRTGGVDVVTTASPFIADCVKKHFPNTKVRASVNMSIGTVKAIEYLDNMPEGIVDLSKVKARHRIQSGAGRK